MLLLFRKNKIYFYIYFKRRSFHETLMPSRRTRDTHRPCTAHSSSRARRGRHTCARMAVGRHALARRRICGEHRRCRSRARYVRRLHHRRRRRELPRRRTAHGRSKGDLSRCLRSACHSGRARRDGPRTDALSHRLRRIRNDAGRRTLLRREHGRDGGAGGDAAHRAERETPYTDTARPPLCPPERCRRL